MQPRAQLCQATLWQPSLCIAQITKDEESKTQYRAEVLFQIHWENNPQRSAEGC